MKCTTCMSEDGERMKLIGGVFANLCVDCVNELAVFAESTAEFVALENAEARFHATLYGGVPHAAELEMEMLRKRRKAMRDIVKQWLRDNYFSTVVALLDTTGDR